MPNTSRLPSSDALCTWASPKSDTCRQRSCRVFETLECHMSSRQPGGLWTEEVLKKGALEQKRNCHFGK